MPHFPDLVCALSANQREDRDIVFIDGDDKQRALSFARLRPRALQLLGALQRRGVARGEAMILFVGDNERFVEMFWACLHGGIVPVPLAAGGTDEHRRKLFRVFAQFDRAWVYGETSTLERLDRFAAAQGLSQDWQRMREVWLGAGTLDLGGEPGTTIAPAPEDVAFIQFSSGSTSEPKGVVLTHRNLCANIAAIAAAARFSDRDLALSWMPLSHDMGLIGFHLNMLACGVTHAIMRTDLFARRPLLWLELASRRRATVLCSPNFGYQHYLRQYRSQRPQGLDLSSVRLIFNGAEPISAELCREFLEAMAPHRLNPNSMFTVYGLAEASLAVSFPQPGAPLQRVHLDRAVMRIGEPVRPLEAGDPRAASYVVLGRPIPGTAVRIAGDAREPLAESRLGHVHIRGDNVTAGYFRNEQATRLALGDDGWLDTGDLGFITGGQLVITGRSKDILFVGGQNYYPHDLERIAEGVDGIEANKVAAAAVNRGGAGEALALFVLHRGPPAALAPLALALRRAINQQTGLEVAHVVPVRHMPRTTSGKLQRYVLARAFESGEFDEALAALEPLLCASSAGDTATVPAASTASRLMAICERIVPERQITLQANLLEINLNSLTLARIHEAIDQEFPQRIEVTDLFDYPTLEALAAFLDAQSG
ncbi:MAG: non-ribosomal peptide synthetase [Pseudomonadota bacterium]